MYFRFWGFYSMHILLWILLSIFGRKHLLLNQINRKCYAHMHINRYIQERNALKFSSKYCICWIYFQYFTGYWPSLEMAVYFLSGGTDCPGLSLGQWSPPVGQTRRMSWSDIASGSGLAVTPGRCISASQYADKKAERGKLFVIDKQGKLEGTYSFRVKFSPFFHIKKANNDRGSFLTLF